MYSLTSKILGNNHLLCECSIYFKPTANNLTFINMYFQLFVVPIHYYWLAYDILLSLKVQCVGLGGSYCRVYVFISVW